MNMIYVGSMNAKKAREIRSLLADLPVEVCPLPVAGITEIEETGTTFQENARLKALGLARQLSACVVADDSGLEVDALDGRPGVYSARYAGPGATDDMLCVKLLGELADVPDGARTARFRCAIAFADPDGLLLETTGACEGSITRRRRGDNGFGYDPVFIPAGYDRTFGEMAPEDKHRLSHRGQALRAFRRALAAHLASAGAD